MRPLKEMVDQQQHLGRKAESGNFRKRKASPGDIILRLEPYGINWRQYVLYLPKKFIAINFLLVS